jgi:hypothetical protein
MFQANVNEIQTYFDVHSLCEVNEELLERKVAAPV